MTLDMIQEDINRSAEYVWGFESCDLCPIAMMLIRHGYNEVHVDTEKINFVDPIYSKEKIYVCDKSIAEWIQDLTSFNGNKPITLSFFSSFDEGPGYVTVV